MRVEASDEDEWKKRQPHICRAWHAPEGVPVGTEYHWYILADQNVRKVHANNYTTSTTGLKYKLAHKRAERKMEHHRK